MLALSDQEGRTEEEVLDWLQREVQGDFTGKYEVLIAAQDEYGYEGCCFFLLKSKEDGQLYEVSGYHCSCNSYDDCEPQLVTQAYYNQANSVPCLEITVVREFLEGYFAK